MDKDLVKFCIKNGFPFIISFEKSWINNPFEEYNTDTSAGHPTSEGDDIVRYSEETQRVKDKEP